MPEPSSSIDRYRVDPPAHDAATRWCPQHPREEQVYVGVPITMWDTGLPALVRGWVCRLCWSPRGFALDGLEIDREGRRS